MKSELGNTSTTREKASMKGARFVVGLIPILILPPCIVSVFMVPKSHVYVLEGENAAVGITMDSTKPTKFTVSYMDGGVISSTTHAKSFSIIILSGKIKKPKAVYKIVAERTGLNNTKAMENREVTVEIFESVSITGNKNELVTLGVGPGTTTMKCAATGSLTIETEWYKLNGSQWEPYVSGLILVLNNELSNSTGQYKCTVSNKLLDKSFSDSKNFTVRKQPGPPTLLSIISTKCGPSVNITWQPDPGSVGLPHRLMFLYDDDGKRKEENMASTPTSPDPRVFLTAALKPMKKYQVSIWDCSGSCVKSDMRNFTTGVLPAPTVNASVAQPTKNGHCTVSWASHPKECAVSQYQVLVKAVYRYPTNVAVPPDREHFVKSETVEYELLPEPNREYTFEVSAENCVGIGNKTVAAGACVRDRAAPDVINAPEHITNEITNGEAKIKLFQANEANGAISCYFVIVKEIESGAPGGSKEVFTMTRLNRAEETTKLIREGDPRDEEYIAASLERKLPDNGMFTLGNDFSTSCDITATNPAINSSSTPSNASNFVYGENFPLRDDSHYRIFVVSVTPGEGIFYLQNSESIVIPPDSGYIALLIILPVITGVILVMVFVIIIMTLRRRNRKRVSIGGRVSLKTSAVNGGDDNETDQLDVNGADIVDENLPEEQNNYENLRKRSENASSSGVVVKSGPKENGGFIGTEAESQSKPHMYENLRTIADDTKAAPNADKDGELYMTMDNSGKKEGPGQSNEENIYLEPMKSPALTGESLYENLRPSSATEALYDNVENREARSSTAGF